MKIVPSDYGIQPAAHRPVNAFRLGVDVGSTTSKLALVGPDNRIVHTVYQRHQADVLTTLLEELDNLVDAVGDISVCPVFTGSAGMGLAERTGFSFIQEVVAASKAVLRQYPASRMLVDIGGEDCKMIFFGDRSQPDMRMNGSCAGGTGAFIDQMACLIDLSLEAFDRLASEGMNEHVIASRCGVFAKTDIQNLINTGVPKSDIARSVFRAVSYQAVSSLARGRKIEGPVVLVGGPLHFFQSLRTSLLEVLSISENEAVVPAESLIFPAYGAALSTVCGPAHVLPLGQIIRTVRNTSRTAILTAQHEPLFSSPRERETWRSKKDEGHRVLQVPIDAVCGPDIFLGIDAGSTTTKIVAIDDHERILFKYYAGNKGAPLQSVKKGLLNMVQEFGAHKEKFRITRSVVTGYGEDLIKTAFEIEQGVVETIAHYRAAQKLEQDVSFILDIGGQDMKAIFVRNGVIEHIEINEACSSGCGSFIETFAESLNFGVDDFAAAACTSAHPVELGSRCTVFMNSCVKQALRQGNGVADVAAGLAYSVVENCLHKVLRISDTAAMGNKIVVQGGTFKNPAVLRALEKRLGMEVVRPDIAEYMGAYGAALIAREQFHMGMAGLCQSLDYKLGLGDPIGERQINCSGCTNHCTVTSVLFPNSRRYYTGNRCERVFTNRNADAHHGDNLVACKTKLLEMYPRTIPEAPSQAIGIPMVLNMFENYPFWSTFFSELGWKVVASTLAAGNRVKDSVLTVMSDNICHPAKLAHAHILDLIGKKVDRIFYPRVVYERSDFKDSANHYNCPIVSGYPDVIDSAIDPAGAGVPLDCPTLNFNDEKLLKAACLDYTRRFGIDTKSALAAFAKAQLESGTFKAAVRQAGAEIIDRARAAQQRIIVLGGRPYHDDPAIHHGIPEMIAGMGIHVITADALPLGDARVPQLPQVVDQWEYSNRLYRAAHWVGREPLADFVQLNSFGCGPDAVVIDEMKSILNTYSISPAVLKIDEITSIGSARLRIRSLIESRSTSCRPRVRVPRPCLPVFSKKDTFRTVLFPDFSPVYSFFAQAAFGPMGYAVEILPPPDKESVKIGLKHMNNDICYPAVVAIGDILKALATGRYDISRIAVGLTETGGQCRATNYVSILKKALLNAGYADIPVVSISFNKHSSNKQPGFVLNRPRLICLVFSSLMVVDQLIRMFHATAVREERPGDSLAVLSKYLDYARTRVGGWTLKDRNDILEMAIRDFNGIPTHSGTYPKAGLVGEIYVKYNPFSNGNIVDRLMRSGIQVVIPPLITFFLQKFINVPFNHEHHIEKSSLLNRQLLKFFQHYIDDKITQINRLMTGFRHNLDPIVLPQTLSAKAGRILSLCNQAGEGWLLPGEIVAMVETGIRNIICLQPFGCIANHVVGKGIASKITNLYPELNLLNLDMDAGNSDANIQNRLDFFIHAAREHPGGEPAPANACPP